jgi:hypothetical protein
MIGDCGEIGGMNIGRGKFVNISLHSHKMLAFHAVL